MISGSTGARERAEIGSSVVGCSRPSVLLGEREGEDGLGVFRSLVAGHCRGAEVQDGRLWVRWGVTGEKKLVQ